MKKLLLIITMSGLSLSLFSQSLSPIVISSSGKFFSNGSGMLSTTVGEMSMVNTFSSGSSILTQGFQQPWDFAVSVPELNNDHVAFSVYPNPGHGMFNLALNTDKDSKVVLQVYDLLGRAVYAMNFYHPSGFNLHEIDLKNLTEGIYTLEIINVEISSGSTTRNISKLQIIY
jgi:hypothetical protein